MTVNLVQEIVGHFAPALPERLGVAVSGGSDSLALLHLLATYAASQGISLHCVTVNHCLRAEAAGEAQAVASLCAGLDIPHDTLVWGDWDGQGNTQDAARRARYRLMADWGRNNKISDIAIGHTCDDQAETVLMRLARGAGTDGLSAMATTTVRDGITWHRPLLAKSRAELRGYLASRDIAWVDDPSNDDAQYDRIKARQALAELSGLGINASVLGQVAKHMQSARDALEHQARHAAHNCATVQVGAVCVDWAKLQDYPAEISRRIILAALRWIVPSDYPPRGKAISAAIKAVTDQQAATCGGCMLRLKGNNLWICREFNAVCEHKVSVGELWDHRWIVTGEQPSSDNCVAALGDNGLLLCPNWRDIGLPRDVLKVLPAVWQGGNLVAAPLVNSDATWQSVLKEGDASFFDAPFSH